MENILLNENEIMARELNNQNNWEEISRGGNLTEEQLILYKSKLDWRIVLSNQKNLSNKLLDKLIKEEAIDLDNRLISDRISSFHASDLDFIKKYKDKLNMGSVFRRNNFKISIVKDLIKTKPEIGMGVTMGCGSDCYPYTIIEINKSGTRIKVQQDNAKPDKENGFDYYSNQVYIYSPNLNGAVYEVSLRKDGNWKVIGSSQRISLGNRNYHQDPSF